jgi:hypothetical protein
MENRPSLRAVLTAVSVGFLVLTAMLGFVVELPVKGWWIIYPWSHITRAFLVARPTGTSASAPDTAQGARLRLCPVRGRSCQAAATLDLTAPPGPSLGLTATSQCHTFCQNSPTRPFDDISVEARAGDVPARASCTFGFRDLA